MRWWFFHRKNDVLTLAVDKDFPNRPSDANPSLGNSHTPWYQTKDHFDEYHVHLRAAKYETAIKKAYKLLNKHP